MMKKFLLMILLLISFCSCGTIPKDEPRDLGYLGEWYIDTYYKDSKMFGKEIENFSKGKKVVITKDKIVNLAAVGVGNLYSYDNEANIYSYENDSSMSNYTIIEYIEIINYDDLRLELNVINKTIFHHENKEVINSTGHYILSKEPFCGSFEQSYKGEYDFILIDDYSRPLEENQYYGILNQKILKNTLIGDAGIFSTNDKIEITDNSILFKKSEMYFMFDDVTGDYRWSKPCEDGEINYEISTIYEFDRLKSIDLAIRYDIDKSIELYGYQGELYINQIKNFKMYYEIILDK